MTKNLLFLSLFILWAATPQSWAGNSPAPKGSTSRSNAPRGPHHAVGGSGFTIELRNGQMWAWGNNTFGQLGNGDITGTAQSSPVRESTLSTSFTDMTAGSNHALAVKADGTIWAWGKNDFGQLGIGNTTNQFSPVQIGTDKDWVSVGCGANHSFAIKANGTLWAWGNNSAGQLGIGNNSNTPLHTTPVQVGTVNSWTSVAGTFLSSAAIRADGTLWTWGDNTLGQLGRGNFTNNSSNFTPAQVTGLLSSPHWLRVECGKNFVFAVRTNGSLYGWGENSTGQLGDNSTTNRNAPKRVGTSNNWVGMSCGIDGSSNKFHTVAMQADGSVWAWGDNTFGQLGNGTTSITPSLTPVLISSGFGAVNVECGYACSFARKANGQLYAWGNNATGNLGTGNQTNLNTPTTISIIPIGWFKISNGDLYSMAIKSDGTLWGWGNNSKGQLGKGDTISVINPVQIGTDNNWVSIAAGKNHTLGLKSNGSVYAWGSNDFGQLGIGNNLLSITNYSPVLVSTGPFVAISSGELFSGAIKANGTLWLWGNNSAGQLGIGNILNLVTNYVPVPVVSLDSLWVDIECGSGLSMAIKSSGSLWSWGDNTLGQLGNGTNILSTLNLSPSQVSGPSNWICIANGAGGGHSLGVRANGTLWSWGQNSFGELGNGTNTNAAQNFSPTQVGTANTWTFASAGGHHSFALQADGSPWAWGDNTYGQLGLGYFGNTPPVYVPTQVTNVQNFFQAQTDLVIDVSCGYNHTGMIKDYRERVCMAGLNSAGQLGDGQSGPGTNKNIFECVVYAPPCISPDVPGITTPPATICSGGSLDLDILSGNLNSATNWKWYSGSCGGTLVGTGTHINVSPTTTTTYFVRGEGGCTAPGTCVSVVVNVIYNPTVLCAGNVNANAAAGMCAAIVTYPNPAVTGPATLTYSFSGATTASGLGSGSGSLFNKGTTQVTYTATNMCSTATCSFNVIVSDNSLPTITAPANITLCSGLPVNLGSPAVSDNCGNVTVTNNAPGSFAVGTTIVVWTADDGNGNTATANQAVTINPLPVASTITAGGPTTFCSGEWVALSGNVGGTWSNGDVTASSIITTGGNYFVTNSNSCGSVTSNSITVTVITCNNLPVTKLRTDDCGRLNYRLQTNNRIIADYIGAGPYEFEFTNSSSQVVATAQGSNVLYLNNVTPALSAPATYTVKVRAITNSTWGNFGPPCTIGILGDAIPANTKLRDADCGKLNYRLNTNNRLIADNVGGGTYEFEFTNTTTSVVTTKQVAGNTLYLNTVTPTLGVPAQYNVRVRANVNGVWGNFGATCLIGITSVAREAAPYVDGSEEGSLTDLSSLKLSVYPNPYSGETNLMIQSPVNEKIQASVYDMIGNNVWNKQVNANENYMIGSEFAKGTYIIKALNNNGNQLMYRMIKVE